MPAVRHVTIHVTQLPVEQKFYELELRAARIRRGGDAVPSFGATFQELRKMTNHPEAGEVLRSAAGVSDVGSVMSVDAFAQATVRRWSIAGARRCPKG